MIPSTKALTTPTRPPEAGRTYGSHVAKRTPFLPGMEPLEKPRGLLASSEVYRTALYEKYADKIVVNPQLNRALVSYQGNKTTNFHRWLKYKEAFSSSLVLHLLQRFQGRTVSGGRVLDPFAGIGTTLTTAAEFGWQATGIELLPIGPAAVRARIAAELVNIELFEAVLERLNNCPFTRYISTNYRFPHLAITRNAFPKETEEAIGAYLAFVSRIREKRVRYLFWFACLSTLEQVSYTRKDGQYLRWDFRAGRNIQSKFNKGTIPDFRTAIIRKLELMLLDLKRRSSTKLSRRIRVIEGSCLTELTRIPDTSFELIITSPPYCNRYDYTRTYALELALMDKNEEEIKSLRQALLSCTVENKSKRDLLADCYRSMKRDAFYTAAVRAFHKQEALHEILRLLYQAKQSGELNNNNVPSMVENYFFEMNLVVHELARVLVPGGHILMVNDNVQYNGEEVPVDFILSDLAVCAGLRVDQIWVLPRGKGNSSQQMGAYGRKEIRKCLYVWSRPVE